MNVNTRLRFPLNFSHCLETSMLSNKNDAQYDSGLTRDYRRINSVQTVSVQWLAKWTDNYSTRLLVSGGTDRGEEALNGSTSTVSYDQTEISTLMWTNEYRLGAHLFSASVENRKDQFLLVGSSAVPVGSAFVSREKAQNSVGLGYGWTGGAHTVQLNMRRDRDSEFGGKSTGSAGYAYALSPQWKVSSSAGNSFRVPILYQRFTIYAPLSVLLPEEGRNLELGLKYLESGSNYGVVAYRNKMTNLLSFVSGVGACPSGLRPAATREGCYANTLRAEYTGLTFTASEKMGNYRLYGSLDTQSPKDTTTNLQLIRRAKQHATFGVDTHVGQWTLAGDVLLSSMRYNNATNTSKLPGYALANVSASTLLAKDWKALLRVDNLADKMYQTVSGYATARRTLYVGLTWAPH
jgi:vitamin B12 transporter